MEILNVKQVAKYLNCSASTIRNLVKNNAIPFFRIGSKLNFNKEAVDIWIHNQEVQNIQPKEIEVKRYNWG